MGGSNSFFAGAAKIDITPPLGTFINGDFLPHYAQHIHDRLYSKALVLKNDQVSLAMVVVDICVIPNDLCDEIRKMISTATGIDASGILVSSTHTHAAGSVASVYLAAADLMYIKRLPELIVASVESALKNMKPAQTGFGKVIMPEHVRCRRYIMNDAYHPINPVSGEKDQVKTNPFNHGHQIVGSASKPDPEVSYLAVKGTNDKWIALLANYSLHYVGDWPNGTISADYFGVFSQQIKNKLNAGDDFVGIMSNGTSGDVNIWDFDGSGDYPSGHFMKSQLIGSDIARAVYESIEQIVWEQSPELRAVSEELQLNLRKPSIEEVRKAEKIMRDSNYDSIEMDEGGLRSIYAREQVLLNELPDEPGFAIQALRIGSGVIGALGGEIFSETGLWLKNNAGIKNYFTIGLANGNTGYLPPAHEMEKGGYETWRSRISRFDKNAELVVRENTLRIIKSLV